MTNTQSFAARELDILSRTWGMDHNPDDKPVILEFSEQILALCEAFGNSGQSDGSAPIVATCIAQAVKSLLLQEPICPVTGIDDEWMDMAAYNDGKTIYQNNRCGCLFKDSSISNGDPYYLDAIVWKTQYGHTWGSGTALLPDGTAVTARQFIHKFPFTPKTFYIDVIEKEVSQGDFEFYIKNPKQLEKVWKYYRRPAELSNI